VEIGIGTWQSGTGSTPAAAWGATAGGSNRLGARRREARGAAAEGRMPMAAGHRRGGAQQDCGRQGR